MLKELTCIRCPLGCNIQVEMNRNDILSIKGNNCCRGKAYAKKEITSPVRTVTTTLPVKEGIYMTVPVKTSGDVPKEKVLEVIYQLRDVVVKAPITLGDVIIKNVANTDIDVIATKTVPQREIGLSI